MKRSKNLSKPAGLPAWTPFENGVFNAEHTKLLESEPGYIGTFVNSRYQVLMREYDSPLGRVTWLAIVNRDRSARHDWRDFQRIKNELLGPEREAMEVYPAESRLVDTNNQFHLFVLPEGHCIPLGYMERDVADQQVEGSFHKQRPFEVRPADLNKRGFTDGTIEVFGDTEAGKETPP